MNKPFALKLRYTSILILICLPVVLLGQKPRVKNDPTHDDKPIHFGFSLGPNVMDYRIQLSDEAIANKVYVGVSEVAPGINIHAIANLRLAEDFDLRALPGISFNDRYVYYQYFPDPDSVIYGDNAFKPAKLESAYLEMPLQIKYKSKRLNNFRPYLIGGVNYRYDLAIKREYDAAEQVVMLSKSDVYAEIGYGMDFYLTYFKLGLEIKYSLGLTNILEREDRNGELPQNVELYTKYIDKITSQMVILLIHFE